MNNTQKMVRAPIATLILIGSLIGGANATTLIGATGISSPQGSLSSFPLINIINQSGLSNGYTSGVTLYDNFVANTTHSGVGDAGFTNTESSGPQQFIFDLGAAMSIDSVAIWNSDSIGSITLFEVFADDDGNFANGTTSQILGSTALSTNGTDAQRFDFNAVNTRYVVINGLRTTTPPDFYGLGEVAFRKVPEPSSTFLLGIAGLSLALRRSRH